MLVIVVVVAVVVIVVVVVVVDSLVKASTDVTWARIPCQLHVLATRWSSAAAAVSVEHAMFICHKQFVYLTGA